VASRLRTGHQQRERSSRPPDAVAALSIFLLLLVAIPSRLIVGPLGGAGTPAQILGMTLAAFWMIQRAAAASPRMPMRQPVRLAMLAFTGAVLASYIAATTRPIGAEELRSADLGLLIVLSWLGTLFVAMDLVPSRERLDVLMRRLVCVAGALATLGLVQYFTKQPFTNYIQIPGLQANSALTSVYERDGFARPAGTALHPIEFGAVLTMSLPFALHYGFTDQARSLLRRWFPAAVIIFAIPISISRSAVVSTLVSLCFLVPTWTPAVRRRAYAVFIAVGACLYVFVPGLLGTLTGLFTGISSDSSAQSRTGSYEIAGDFIVKSPVVGRGFLTFLPSYRILDNQYLGLLIETGFVGLFAFLGLLITGIVCARRALTDGMSVADRSLAHAFAASVASAAVGFALFDAFAFPMAACLISLILGGGAAFRRLLHDAGRASSTTGLST
jgi:polysaccharide biosynthesis protein PslJ